MGSPLLSESPGRTRSRSLNAIHKAHPELVGLTPLYPLPLLSSLLSPLATFSSLPSILSLSSPLSSLLSPLSSLSPPSTPSLRHSQRLFDDHSAGARISLAPPPLFCGMDDSRSAGVCVRILCAVLRASPAALRYPDGQDSDSDDQDNDESLSLSWP